MCSAFAIFTLNIRDAFKFDLVILNVKIFTPSLFEHFLKARGALGFKLEESFVAKSKIKQSFSKLFKLE